MSHRAWRQVNGREIDQRRTDALPKSDGPHFVSHRRRGWDVAAWSVNPAAFVETDRVSTSTMTKPYRS